MLQKGKIIGFNYDKSTIETELKRNFERLNWRDSIKSDSKIFVKPNFVVPFFKPGVTTNNINKQLFFRHDSFFKISCISGFFY
jgi:hypothetical protein